MIELRQDPQKQDILLYDFEVPLRRYNTAGKSDIGGKWRVFEIDISLAYLGFENVVL